MPTEEYSIEIDDLAIGLTRPSMICGVMVKVAFLNLMLCALAYVYTKSIWVLPIFGIFHLIAVHLSIKEPRFLELRIKKLINTPPVLNKTFWCGNNSYSPY